MKMMEFQEKRSGLDIEHWVKYNAKFGNTHLTAPQHQINNGITLNYDADILLMLAIPVYILYRLTRRILKI